MIALVVFVLLPVAAADAPQTVPVDAPTQFSTSSPGDVSAKPWWEEFGDPLLEKLVRSSLLGNHDLAAAADRILQAEALSYRTLAPLLPSVSLDGQASVAPLESLTFGRGGAGSGAINSTDLYGGGSAMLNLRYRVDIAGRQVLAYTASRLNAMAARGDREGLALFLATQTTAAYLDAVAAAGQVAIIESQIEANENLAELLEMRFDRGEATGLAVLQQRQQLAATRAGLPDARSQLRINRQRLAILSGATPGAVTIKIATHLPTIAPKLALGKPLDLLENRPDLRAAAYRVDAALDQASSAFRAHFPTLDLSGNAGWQFFATNEVTSLFTWSAGALLSLPLFSGGGDVGAVDQAESAERASRKAFQQLFVGAVGDVEAAVVQEQEQRARREAILAQLQASQQSYDESSARYLKGVASFLDVITALTGKQQAELGLLRSDRGVLAARLLLRQALGGPWTANLSTQPSVHWR